MCSLENLVYFTNLLTHNFLKEFLTETRNSFAGLLFYSLIIKTVINTAYLLQPNILLILARYICSVKNTALIKGWQLFQEIFLHVTQLINAATGAADDDGDDNDDDEDYVLTSQSHRSFTKIEVIVYFAGCSSRLCL
jgi:hypothetical protein